MPIKIHANSNTLYHLARASLKNGSLTHTYTLSSKHHYAVGRYDGRWNNDGCESRSNGDKGHRRGKFILWNGPRPEIKAT